MEILNTYHVPVPVQDNVKGAAFLAVLTGAWSGSGEQAVYIGIAGGLDIDASGSDYESWRADAAEWIAYHGQKLPYRKARTYFPSLVEANYRA